MAEDRSQRSTGSLGTRSRAPAAGDAAMQAPAALPADVNDALQRGEHMLAIRLLRQRTGLGLREAKRRVEAAAVGAAPVRPGLAPGEVPHTGSRATWVIVALLLGWLAWRWWAG